MIHQLTFDPLTRSGRLLARAVAPAQGEPVYGVTQVLASAPLPDRADDVVDPSWVLDWFRENPAVPFAHFYDQPLVGRADPATITLDGHGALRMSIKWDTSAENPMGQLMARQYHEGIMRGVSVGFIPGTFTPRSQLPKDDPLRSERGFRLADNELIEVSAAPVPMLRQALAGRTTTDSVRRAVESSDLRSTLVALFKADPELRAIIQACAWSYSEEPSLPLGGNATESTSAPVMLEALFGL
jgi:hypothetical protein